MKETHYQKYEFCEAVNCEAFIPSSQKHSIIEGCIFMNPKACIKTAREFHHWLKDNGYAIVLETTQNTRQSEWISVDDGLPESGERVDLVWRNEFVGIRKRLVGRMHADGKWWTKSERGEKYQIDLGVVTHWKYQTPLPEVE